MSNIFRKKLLMTVFRSLLFVLFSLHTTLATALESADDPFFGPGSVTLDTATDLLWLDMTHTDPNSNSLYKYDYVSSQFGPGGDFEGFRYATQAEVFTMFSNAGIPVVPGNSPSNEAPILALIDLIGTASSSAGEVQGFTGTPSSPGRRITVYAAGTEVAPSNESETGTPNFNTGSWLVKTAPPPTPASDVDGDGVPDVSDPCPGDPDPTNPCDIMGSAAEEVSTSTGGTVETQDEQLEIAIDPGDLTEDTVISVTASDPAEANIILQAGAGQPLAVYDLKPDGLSFDSPVTLNIQVDVSHLSSLERASLDIYRKEDTNSDAVPDTFLPLTATCVVTEDPANVFVAHCSVELGHFSDYALVAPIDSDEDGIFDDFDGIVDACPAEDSTGFDSDADGCIDTITGLTELVSSLVFSGVIESQMENSLLSKLANVQKSQDKDNICAMVDQLESFKSQVAAQTGKKISTDAGSEVTAYVDRVIAFVMLALPEGESCD